MKLKRLGLLLLLFGCAAGWAGLMSVDFVRRRATPAADGSSAAITYFDYDQSDFADVTVYLSVLDPNGEPVLGLIESDFTITEDDVRVNVSDFIGGGAQPVTAVMLIDHSGSMQDAKMKDAIAAALAFLDHLQNGRDRLGVVAFDNDTTMLGTLRLMDSSIRADLEGRISDLTADGGTAYYDAIYEAVGMLGGVSGRKVVLALTDGIDEHSNRARSSVVDYALDHNVALYTIGLGADVEQWVLEQMAQETGGQYYEEPSGSELADLYAALARSLQDEYSLTYTSPTPRLDGSTRQVEATARLPAGSVTAVGSYAVGGTLTPSLNLWPCLGILPLLLLLALPGLYARVRGRGGLAEVEPTPVPPPPVAPPPPASAPTAPPQPAPAAACSHCGASLRAGARFCRACGQAVTAARQPETVACAYCGAPLRDGARFCRSCGQPVIAVPS
ncbi:MAG: VWA domain-containing protein, partial [Chloroflexota bacterium]|nr:VWA domain-containing protein [Chloroflexota bacterium]